MELSYISGNKNPKKLLILQEVIFRAQKIRKNSLKKLFILREMELYSLKLKKLLIFQEALQKPENQKVQRTFQR